MPLPIGLPRIQESPSNAAQHMRQVMGIAPDIPILHVIDAIERLGVVILALPLSLDRIDAFSTWIGAESPKPIIATCSGKPGDRMRFSVAHELGHLVMHYGRKQLRAEDHHEADHFAGAFMMPEVSMRREFTYPDPTSIATKTSLGCFYSGVDSSRVRFDYNHGASI